MTLQEAFDTAYRGLAAQGFQKSEQDFGCAYRGDKGLRCAIGHLIPDDLYNPKFEGYAADGLPQSIIRFIGLPVLELEGLQDCHDGGDRPEIMEGLLADFADDHGLTIPEVAS